MTYSETVQYLYDLAPSFQHIGVGAYKEGLDNTVSLDKHLGHPHRKFRTIHVAGTRPPDTTPDYTPRLTSPILESAYE